MTQAPRIPPGCRVYWPSRRRAPRRASASPASFAVCAEPWRVAFPGEPIPADVFGRFDLGAWLTPTFCARSVRGVIKLAQNQLGGLIYGDRLITAGTVSNRFGRLLVGLCFEQLFLLAQSYSVSKYSWIVSPRVLFRQPSANVVRGDVLLPIALARPQLPACGLECFGRGIVAGSFGCRAQRQTMPRAQVTGKCLFPGIGQAFKFDAVAGLEARCACFLGHELSRNVVR